MRTLIAVSLLSAFATTAPAQTRKVSAADACKTLLAKASKFTSEKVRCEAAEGGLRLADVSDAARVSLERELFPEGSFLGHKIVQDAPVYRSLPVTPIVAAKGQKIELDAARERVKAAAVAPVFDEGVRSGDVAGRLSADFGLGAGDDVRDSVAAVPAAKNLASTGEGFKLRLMQGPPGSGGADQDTTRRSGPPGSGGGRDQQDPSGGQGGPPGSGGQTGPRQGPPGSGGGNNGNSPSTTPPSRPAPVWRSSFPPPAPNWWNTDFNHYNWWNGLPQGYDRAYKDDSNPDSIYWYSGWYRWRDVFVTNWERDEDRATITRNASNQGQVHTRALTSQSHRESKECYYQAVYRYDWEQGGFYGSHWEEHFDHYKASCIRLPREYGTPRTYTVAISFDMSQAQGQDLPWESDVITVKYDGQGQPRYDFSGASYNYSIRTDNQRQGSESLTFIAGNKLLRAPEANKVQAFLRLNAGKVELVINDDRAQFYQGETLRVTAKVVRRVVYKEKGLLWGWNEKRQDSVIHNAPIDVLVDASNPQTITDLSGAANGAKPANFVRQSVYIDSWEFVRVNSRVSSAAVMRQGRGSEVAY